MTKILDQLLALLWLLFLVLVAWARLTNWR